MLRRSTTPKKKPNKFVVINYYARRPSLLYTRTVMTFAQFFGIPNQLLINKYVWKERLTTHKYIIHIYCKSKQLLCIDDPTPKRFIFFMFCEVHRIYVLISIPFICNEKELKK